MMTFINHVVVRRAKNLAKTFFDVSSFAAKNRKVICSSKLERERLSICETCERYGNGMCDVCGCVMKVKVKFVAAKCPLADEGQEPKW